MEADGIKEVGIDDKGQIYIMPYKQAFPYIYRAAMEVHWDDRRFVLHSPVPREWSYVRWFMQIWAAVKQEYGCVLMLSSDTHWHNVTEEIKNAIIAWYESNEI